MTFFLCKKEHFNNLDQLSNMDFPSIKYFFFFCQLIFRVQNKNEGTCFIQHTATHTVHSILISLTLLNVTFDLLVGMSELALDQTN